MLFKKPILEGIAAGRITLAFRRWKRPTVKAGGTLQTGVGVLAIHSVDPIDEARITAAAARRAGFESRADLLNSLGDRDGQLFRIAFQLAGKDPRIALRAKDRLGERDIKELQTRLERMDRRSQVGPWTTAVLQLIVQFPEVRAGELAARGGYEKAWLKSNIRKLKNLGLTESLAIGYRLSPRGRAFLNRLSA